MTAEADLLPCPGRNGTNTRVIGGPGTRALHGLHERLRAALTEGET